MFLNPGPGRPPALHILYVSLIWRPGLRNTGLGYKKFGNRVSGQGQTEVFQDGFHWEQASQGSIKDVESLCSASGEEAPCV